VVHHWGRFVQAGEGFAHMAAGFLEDPAGHVTLAARRAANRVAKALVSPTGLGLRPMLITLWTWL